MEVGRLTRDGTAEPVSRDQILRREQRGQGNIDFSCSADHVQYYWQPYPVDPYPCYMCDNTYNIYLSFKINVYRILYMNIFYLFLSLVYPLVGAMNVDVSLIFLGMYG